MRRRSVQVMDGLIPRGGAGQSGPRTSPCRPLDASRPPCQPSTAPPVSVVAWGDVPYADPNVALRSQGCSLYSVGRRSGAGRRQVGNGGFTARGGQTVQCGLVERSLGEIVREAMQQRGMNIKQLTRRTAELGDAVSEGTVHNVLKSRVSHSRYDTIRPLCAALDLDYNAVLAELRRPAHQIRTLPEDVHHLTDEQWRALVELAKQFRIANEGRQRPAGSADGGQTTSEV